jgi:hypothetical protein
LALGAVLVTPAAPAETAAPPQPQAAAERPALPLRIERLLNGDETHVGLRPPADGASLMAG